MKERPILFSGSMVRAIREGRKTQTRRVIKPQPECLKDLQAIQYHLATGEPLIVGRGCSYGQPGDRLWVRETWAQDDRGGVDDNGRAAVYYRADMPSNKVWSGSWKPSIYMPRWSSRITLEIVSVRVERLQDISDFDAYKEGAESKASRVTGPYCMSYVEGFKQLWESINGVGSWDLYTWVWVIEFKEVKP